MNIDGSVALVTGANRGIGAAYANALLDRGAAKVYAAVRDVSSVGDPRLIPVRLDVTDRASIAAAAQAAPDVTLLFTSPTSGGYSSAKAAMWAATNSLQNLLQQGTLVTAVHAGYVDTDMTAAVDAPKVAPEVIVAATLDALEAGEHEVLADETARQVRAALSAPPTALYPVLATPGASR
jgi:NAD(P)-dependent dehydrogenase (short-subunit alcohol dehydrogenase family)